MNAIKVGNVILMKDKLVSITQEGKSLDIITTICKTTVGYQSEEDAKKVLDEFYNQLNKD